MNKEWNKWDDIQRMRIGDETDERRSNRIEKGDMVRMRLEKKYETKTKILILKGEKETDVKFEHNNILTKVNERRRYTYPNNPYGLLNNERIWGIDLEMEETEEDISEEKE